jgi:transcriptional regulator with XRE-family HTH domain
MTPKRLSLDDVLSILRTRLGAGSAREMAEELGVSAGYLHDVLRGNRQPGPSILAPLNLEKIEEITVYYRNARKQAR